jgi:hypothetical protein
MVCLGCGYYVWCVWDVGDYVVVWEVGTSVWCVWDVGAYVWCVWDVGAYVWYVWDDGLLLLV